MTEPNLPKSPDDKREYTRWYVKQTEKMEPQLITASDDCVDLSSLERRGTPLTLEAWQSFGKPCKSEPDFSKIRPPKLVNTTGNFCQAPTDSQSPLMLKQSLEDTNQPVSGHTSLTSISSTVSSLGLVYGVLFDLPSSSSSGEPRKPKIDWVALAPEEEGSPETPRGLIFPFPISVLTRRASEP